MYYGKELNLTEQKAFSNLKSDVRGLGQRLKTGFQNVASSFSKTQGVSQFRKCVYEREKLFASSRSL